MSRALFSVNLYVCDSQSAVVWYACPEMRRRSLLERRFVSAVLLLSLATSCNRPRVLIQPTSAMEPTILKDEKLSADMSSDTRATVVRGQIILFEYDGRFCFGGQVGDSLVHLIFQFLYRFLDIC